VCVFLCFSHEPHERVSLYYRLSLLDEGFSGAFTNAQSTLTSSSNINFPSMFSIALCASSFSLYSIKQYPLTNPVLRSKFKCKFEISPKSPKFSWTSSSCASSWTPVTRTTQPSMDFCGWPRCPPLSPSPSLKVSYRSFRECFTSSSITSAFSKPRPCGEKYENVALTMRGDETHARNGDEHRKRTEEESALNDERNRTKATEEGEEEKEENRALFVADVRPSVSRRLSRRRRRRCYFPFLSRAMLFLFQMAVKRKGKRKPLLKLF
jgi:hypothetical protein